MNKILYNVSQEELNEEDTKETESEEENYTGKTPSVIKFSGQTYEISSWMECLQTVAREILRDTDEKDKITEITGTKRDYFAKEQDISNLVYPKDIPDTDYFFEGKLSANDVVRITKKVMRKYDYDTSELEIYTEEEQN